MKIGIGGIFILIILASVWIFTAIVYGIPDDIGFFSTNTLIIIFTLVLLMLSAEYYFSLSKLVYLFFFVFFGVVPYTNELTGVLFWEGETLKIEAKVETNLIILLGLLVYYIGQKLKSNESFFVGLNARINRGGPPSLFLISIVFSLSIFLVINYHDFDFTRMIFRRVEEDLVGSDWSPNTMEMLIIGNIVRPIPIITCFLLYLYYMLNFAGHMSVRLKIIVIVFAFIVAILVSLPSSLARYMVSVLYLPFLIVFTRFLDNRVGFSLLMVFALVLVMPVLDVFRFTGLAQRPLSVGFEYLNTANFDAYQNFARVVDSDFITWGYQLFGVLLFFVPRSIWTDKPIGSGAQYAIDNDYLFTNISMPYIAEGYVNFGVAGVVLFMFFLGTLFGGFDRYCWRVIFTYGKHGVLQYYYYFILSLSFFLMRGDLLSSFSYIVGVTIAFFSVQKLFRL